MTTYINTIEAKEQFSDLVNRVAHNGEHVILTRRGKDIAVIISIDDYKLLQTSQDKYDLREAIDSLKTARDTGTISLESLSEELGA